MSFILSTGKIILKWTNFDPKLEPKILCLVKGKGSFALKRRAALAGATLSAIYTQTQTAFTDIGRLHILQILIPISSFLFIKHFCELYIKLRQDYCKVDKF